MSRIAIFADVHGNLPALEAVLADIERQGVDEILVGGDLVGRGPQGTLVARRVRELGLAAIGGNHEDYLLGFRRGEIPAEWQETEEWAASRWMAAELDPREADYLATLPFSLERPGLRLVHGTPRSNRQGIGPWTDDQQLEAVLADIDEDLLVCAHTHRPLDRRVASGRAVNVGSVGLPFNRDQRAQYAIFSRADGGGWEVEFRQVDYELEAILEIYRRSGFLAEGGVTARLLFLELEHASPLLVPFLEWCRACDEEPVEAQLKSFFAAYSPGEPLAPFFRRLRRRA